MQVSLAETILDHLSGSNRAKPVIESDLLRLGRKSDVAQALNDLDSSRKIIRCNVTKEGKSNNLIFLSGQIIGPGRLSLDNLSSGNKTPVKERLRYCKGCDKDLSLQSFAKFAQRCVSCMIKK